MWLWSTQQLPGGTEEKQNLAQLIASYFKLGSPDSKSNVLMFCYLTQQSNNGSEQDL
jgi:hypothetical protein